MSTEIGEGLLAGITDRAASAVEAVKDERGEAISFLAKSLSTIKAKSKNGYILEEQRALRDFVQMRLKLLLGE